MGATSQITRLDEVSHACSSPIAASVMFHERVDGGGDSGSIDVDARCVFYI